MAPTRLPEDCIFMDSSTLYDLGQFRPFWARKRGGNHQRKLVLRKGEFNHLFSYGVTHFKSNFLSPPWSKIKNFSAHQKAEDLRISKLTPLLFLVPFLGELWPLKTWGTFFLRHPVYFFKLTWFILSKKNPF